MASNIEIKARVRDLATLQKLTRAIATSELEVLLQKDIFFYAKKGRLKLRIFADGRGELICYERPNIDGIKQSIYQIYRTGDPEGLRSVLAASLGEMVIVKKRRELYLVGQTRVHLDKVEDLGTFMELEVVLRDEQSVAEGERIARELMVKLGVEDEDLIDCAYADLLMKN